MLLRHTTPLRSANASRLAVLASVLMIAAIPQASAQQASIGGSWNGNGTVSLPSGNTEKVRCRATFNPSGNGATMSATCASPSARVSQSANLTRVAANRFSGDFTNPEYGISGSIKITINGNNLSAALTGGGGSAYLNLSR